MVSWPGLVAGATQINIKLPDVIPEIGGLRKRKHGGKAGAKGEKTGAKGEKRAKRWGQRAKKARANLLKIRASARVAAANLLKIGASLPNFEKNGDI